MFMESDECGSGSLSCHLQDLPTKSFILSEPQTPPLKTGGSNRGFLTGLLSALDELRLEDRFVECLPGTR